MPILPNHKLAARIIGGTAIYLDAGGTQTIYEYTPTSNIMLQDIKLDLVNITQNGNIVVSCKVDGSTYRIIKQLAFTVLTDDDGVVLIFGGMIVKSGSSLKVEYTEDVNEAADRNIIYEISFVGV